MRVPPFFKDLPNDAVRRVVDLLNQPQLMQTVKDAANQIGVTTEWGASQVQDSMRQAKRWLDSVSTRWTASAPTAAVPVINASGSLFCSEYSLPPSDAAANAAYSSIFAGAIQESLVRSELERQLVEISGAESAIVLSNVSTAIQYTAMHPSAVSGVIVPRGCCIRLPDGGDVLAILRRMGSAYEVGAVNELTLNDLQSLSLPTESQKKVSLLQIFPSSSRNEGDNESDFVSTFASEWEFPSVEVRYDGTLCDIREEFSPSVPVSERLSAGASSVILPGDMLIGGVRCAIVLGKSTFIEPMREMARLFGGYASPLASVMMLGALEANRSAEAWRSSTIGEVLSCTIANQLHRARKIAAQLEGSAWVSSVAVHEQSSVIGNSVWNTIETPTVAIEVVPKESLESIMHSLSKYKRRIVTKPHRTAIQLVMRTVDPADDREIVSAFGAFGDAM